MDRRKGREAQEAADRKLLLLSEDSRRTPGRSVTQNTESLIRR